MADPWLAHNFLSRAAPTTRATTSYARAHHLRTYLLLQRRGIKPSGCGLYKRAPRGGATPAGSVHGGSVHGGSTHGGSVHGGNAAAVVPAASEVWQVPLRPACPTQKGLNGPPAQHILAACRRYAPVLRTPVHTSFYRVACGRNAPRLAAPAGALLLRAAPPLPSLASGVELAWRDARLLRRRRHAPPLPHRAARRR